MLTGESEAADDLAADALLEVWRHWDRVSAAENPAAYARGVVANLARNRIRRLIRERRGLLGVWLLRRDQLHEKGPGRRYWTYGRRSPPRTRCGSNHHRLRRRPLARDGERLDASIPAATTEPGTHGLMVGSCRGNSHTYSFDVPVGAWLTITGSCNVLTIDVVSGNNFVCRCSDEGPLIRA